MQLKATVDARAVTAALQRLSGNEVQAAIVRSLNRAQTTVRSELSKAIRAEVNLRAGDAKAAVTVHRARPGNLTAQLNVAGRPVPLAKFIGTRQTKRGVSVKVLKKGPRRVIPRTFLATMKSGHRGVWWRDKGGGRTGLASRLPIEERFSLAVQQALVRDPKTMDRIIGIARNRIETELRREIQFRLSKRGR